MSELPIGLREALAAGMEERARQVVDFPTILNELRDDNRRHNKDILNKLDAILKQLQTLNETKRRTYSGT